jgi:20S proteasome alpha/beta subunit
MTIALGLSARDSIVVAADREESDGYLKNDTGKILQVLRGRPPIGRIAVTGAGSGAELDEISRLLGNVFCAEGERSSADARAALEAEHRRYYQQTILPFAPQPPLERPDYSLIIGCLQGQTGKALFSTSRLAFNESSDYQAVGIGASVANDWLATLYDFVLSILAVRIAAYVIYQVKNRVSGCGLGTDIVVLKPDKVLARVEPEIIRKWEDAFRYYASLERNVFSYCIGVESDDWLLRTRPDLESVNKGIQNMRKALTPSDAEKSEWGL